ncbi:hypothetical protein D0869_11517 [Hortaea werneckii]|uniref:Uncharacterized protein n=1 Tax=Hortaea werneckii TaxID=91943 RepID=A0A3M6WAP4_HORWE|nr:hypothetical protein D0869_11517 [Hortaea werneckii]
MAGLAATALAEAYTELSPAQSSEIYSKIQTLSATRPVVISVQDAVRSQLPADTFPDPSVGPFFQEDFASLAQAESPVFTEAPWFPSISTDLQAAYRTLEDPALAGGHNVCDANSIVLNARASKLHAVLTVEFSISTGINGAQM